MTESSRSGRSDDRSTDPRPAPRDRRPDGPRRFDDRPRADREFTAELPKLSDFTRKQLQQELMFRRGEIDNGIPELAGFHIDVIQSMFDTFTPIVLAELPPRRPVRPLIDPNQGNGRTDVMDVEKGQTFVAARVTLKRGLADTDLTPVVDKKDGLVLFFVYSDLCPNLGERRFRAIFPGLEHTEDTDGRELYIADLSDEDDEDDDPDFEIVRRTSGSRPPRNPRRTSTPESDSNPTHIVGYVIVAFVSMILGGTVWHYLNMLLSLSGLLGFAAGTLFVVLPALVVLYVYLGRHGKNASHPSRTNHSGSRRYDR